MPRFHPRIVTLAFWSWVGAMGWLTMMPSPPVPTPSLPGWDKVEHAGAFAVFTLLAGLYLESHCRDPWRRAFALAVLYGAVIEVAQGALPFGRSAEWGDLAADTLGAALVCWHMTRRRGRPAT